MALSLKTQLEIDHLYALYQSLDRVGPFSLSNILFPSALAIALEDYGRAVTEEDKVRAASQVCLSYLNKGLSSLLPFKEIKEFSRASFMIALKQLHEAGLPIEEHCHTLLVHHNPEIISFILVLLKNADLLKGMQGQENYRALIAHPEPESIAAALCILQYSGHINTDEGQSHYTRLLTHPYVKDLVRSLSILRYNYPMSRAELNIHCEQVLTHAYPRAIFEALSALQGLPLLSGERGHARLNMFMRYSHALCTPLTTPLWQRLPIHLFTEERFEALVLICQNDTLTLAEKQSAIAQYMTREFMGVHEHLRQPFFFNPSQSTHTTSVHASVSESAIKLKMRYGKLIQGKRVGECLEELRARILTLEPSLIHDASQRCLKRLCQQSHSFIDFTSKVSIHELLALCHLATQDERVLHDCGATSHDAFLALIQGLYEIQRGYNLNDSGVDDLHDTDKVICIAGTFNKLINCLQGIHPDYAVIMKSKATALAKLKPVVIEKAMAYLHAEKGKSSPEDFLNLITKMKSEHLACIWLGIRDEVYHDIQEEFGALLDHEEIDAAVDCMILDLSTFSFEPTSGAGAPTGEARQGLFSASSTSSLSAARHSSHDLTTRHVL